MSFLNIRFPVNISYGAVGGPGYSTDVVTINSGFENRNQNWSIARCSWDCAKGCKTDQDRIDLIAFFRVAKGKMHSFRWRDFTDYEVASGAGVLSLVSAGVYQLKKRYANAAGTEDRTITLPVSPVIKQAGITLVESTHYSINLTTGVITTLGSPSPLPDAWTGQFDVPARFDTDMLRLVIEDLEYFKSQNIPVVEVRV
ncbi:MAG: TIGR02217 family protein [Vicinamibacterales bacterium]